jgi:hypothetical protein
VLGVRKVEEFKGMHVSLAVLACTLLISNGSNAGNRDEIPATLEYRSPVGLGSEKVVMISGKQVIRTLYGGVDAGGLFYGGDSTPISDDGRFAAIDQIEAGFVELPDGSSKLHEVAYCNLVDLHNGCVVVRETGQFCAGRFTKEGKWNNPLYPDLDLTKPTATTIKYADRVVWPADSPDASLENLLACDPPGTANKVAYKKILDLNVFHMSQKQRQIIEALIN